MAGSISGIYGIISCLPPEYLRDASIGDLEYSGDVAGPGALVGELHYLLAGGVRQRPAVDIDSAQLVNPAVAYNRRYDMRPNIKHRVMT